MKDVNTNSKFTQLMPEYVPGIRDDEAAALDNVAKAKTEFESRRGRCEEIASRHKFFTDQAAEYADESRAVNEKIKNRLRAQTDFSHKELISFKAEMRQAIEMMENNLQLSDESSKSLADARVMAEKAANQYRLSRLMALDLVADNMLEAAVGAANNLFLAMYTKVTAFRERRDGERTWAHMGFDSEVSAVIADVSARIASLYRCLDEDYMAQQIPAPFATRFFAGDLDGGSPASWNKAGLKAKANPKPSAT